MFLYLPLASTVRFTIFGLLYLLKIKNLVYTVLLIFQDSSGRFMRSGIRIMQTLSRNKEIKIFQFGADVWVCLQLMNKVYMEAIVRLRQILTYYEWFYVL